MLNELVGLAGILLMVCVCGNISRYINVCILVKL